MEGLEVRVSVFRVVEGEEGSVGGPTRSFFSLPPEETRPRSPKRGIGDRFWCRLLLLSRLQNLVVN